MNSAEHKEEALRLINSSYEAAYPMAVLARAQVHATLATIDDNSIPFDIRPNTGPL